jgi:hypothetical protein
MSRMRGGVLHFNPLKANSHTKCSAHAVHMPCRQGFRYCLSHLIYTMRLCLIHTCHADAHTAQVPCSDHAVLKGNSKGHGTARQGHGMGTAWYL